MRFYNLCCVYEKSIKDFGYGLKGRYVPMIRCRLLVPLQGKYYYQSFIFFYTEGTSIIVTISCAFNILYTYIFLIECYYKSKNLFKHVTLIVKIVLTLINTVPIVFYFRNDFKMEMTYHTVAKCSYP